MQTKLLSMVFAATLIAGGARAQDSSNNPAANTPSAPAPQQAALTAQPTPNQIVYSPRLPNPSELTSVASAQGLTVDQISQTASQVVVTYRYSNGQTSTVAYQLLPTATAPATTVVVPSQAPTVVYQPAPTVVYQTTPRVVYYDTYDPYYPRYYYPPVSLSLGFGYYHGWGGGGWRGGGHYGHRW